MDQQHIQLILLRSLRGELSAEEQILLQEWAAADPEHQALLDDLQDPETVSAYLAHMNKYDAAKAYSKLRDHFDQEAAKSTTIEIIPKRESWLYRFRWAAAAIFLFAVATTWYTLMQTRAKAPPVYTGNVLPGHDGARLRLSNGSIVTLDSMKNGVIATQGGLRIIKEDNKIIYKADSSHTAAATLAYNEIIADNGRKITAQLPDGSTVWLNAGSAVRYPLQFPAHERLVSMTGEAIFRVVHKDKQPFRVKVNNQLVEDIGTEFNINAYDDEPVIRTTMVEGMASVMAGQQKIILKQGQEAQNQDGRLRSAKGDIEKAIAWRNGLFSFDHADLKTVLRQFTRWYDVEVRYEAKIPEETFTGEMERRLTLSEALDNLQRMGVRFRIEADKRIIVLP